jgi:PAS domain S-box-containing protein
MTTIPKASYDVSHILTENFEDLIYILNDKLVCEYINENAHLNLLGYKSISKTLTDFIHYDDIKKSKKFFNRILKSGKALEQLRIQDKDDYSYFEVKGKRFIDKKNKIKILLVLRDISDFKELENKWLEREKKLRELAETLPEIRFWKLLQPQSAKSAFHKTREMLDIVIDNIPHLIYWKNTDLKYLGCNRNFALINKIDDPNFIVGKKDIEMTWLRGNVNLIQEKEIRVMKEDKSENIIELWNLPNGEESWFEINRIPLHNVKGDVVGILVTYNDISERKRAEQKVKESEKKYRSILESIREGYFEVDLDGNFTFFNDSLCEITGFPKNELLGKNYAEMTDEGGKQKLYQLYSDVFRTGKEKSSIQFKFYKKNGVKVIAESSVNLKYDSQGKKIGFFGIVRDITEKFNLEKELKDSEEKYRLISENAYDLISILNQKLRFEYANENPWLITLGYSKNEIIGKSVLDFVHPDDKKNAIKNLVGGLEKGEGVLEVRIKHKNGHYLWIEVKGKAFVDKDGKTKGITIGRDITKRKEIEQKILESEEKLRTLNKELEHLVLERTRELKESEEKFRSIAEQTSLGIIILQDGLIKYVNNAITEITGYSVEEMRIWTQNQFMKKIHPEDLTLVLEHLERKLKKKSDLTSNYGFRIITKSNNIKWVDLHSKAINYQGNIAILATFIDITDKKEAEEKLIESEKKYRHLYEMSPYSIALLNLEGKIIDINSITQKLFGYDKEDLIGRNYHDLFNLYPEDTKAALREIPDLLSRKQPYEPIMKPQIIKIFNKDGTPLWVESQLSAIKLGKDHIIQVIIQDITEKKVAEEKLKESEKILRQQNVELKELDRLKTDFVSIAAHELKTPLISVGGYVDLILMRERDNLSNEVIDDLNRVLGNVRRLEDYVNRLMDVMKIDAKKMELILQEENLFQLIKECIKELDFQITQKKLNLKLSIDESYNLEADSFRISQAFSNILSNAIKFSPEEGIIEISAKKENNDYLIKIKDYGKGLTKEEIKKLFGKFVSLGKTAENFSTFEKGSGLGLYIARGIIEAHGGQIWVDSEGKGKGAEFKFLLPIRK